MKRIVSVSIGSASRDKKVETVILGERYTIERIGTDGSIAKAIEKIKELDGKVDAFGMGGIDLYLSGGSPNKFILRAAIPIIKAAKHSPIVDGTGVKKTLEGQAIKYLRDNNIIDFRGKKVLVTCAIDRFSMAEALVECGCEIIIGDLMFALGIPVPIGKLSTLRILAKILMPVISRLPFSMLYPTGESQKVNDPHKFKSYYLKADIIAGDFHYNKKYMPADMSGKIIITNTVTGSDIDFLKERRVKMLVTTTPEFDGRSFGTNVIEALLVSVSGKKPHELSEKDYFDLMKKLDIRPRVEYL